MENKLQSNIKKYYLYQIFISFEFWMPVMVIFWQSRGLSMTEIMLLQSIYAVAVIILELPTGALADYLGKKIALILGAFFFAAGEFVYSVSFGFWLLAFAEIICAFGMAFISGADKALIHETLISLNRGKEYKKTEGRARSLNQIARATGDLIGGFIGSISLGLTLFVSGITGAIGMLIALTFAKPKVELEREEKTDYLEIIKISLKIVKNNREVLWLTLFFASFNALVWSVNWFSQPYFQMLNIPISYFGIIFAAFAVVSAIASFLVDHFEKVFKEKTFIVLSVIAISSMFLIGRFPSIWMVALWSLFSSLIIMNQTLVSDRVLELVPSSKASTILSFKNLMRRLIYVFSGPVLGWIADMYNLQTALQVNAVVLMVVLGFLFVLKRNWQKGVQSGM